MAAGGGDGSIRAVYDAIRVRGQWRPLLKIEDDRDRPLAGETSYHQTFASIVSAIAAQERWCVNTAGGQRRKSVS